ncbi:MAG: family acetyltransferase [Rhodoferax sp.]|nr:family acetyltransferase [Rhodoferax sp.]
MTGSSPTYDVETSLPVEEFRQVLIASGLGVRRPVDDLLRLGEMVKNANIVVTARIDGTLVGVARALTDFNFCCYLSDLAVSKDAQGNGIGARLIEETRKLVGPKVSVILSSVPESVGFYESIDMSPLPDCFWYRREL